MKESFKYKVEVGPHNELKYLCETNDLDELIENIKNHTKKKIAKSYYWRILDYETYVWIDYGSWSDFVYVYFLDEEAKKAFMEAKITL